MFKQAAAINLTHVPYKGTTQILPDILDGRVDMALDSLPAYLPHLKSGKQRALAIANLERSSLFPDLQTASELGAPGFDYASVFGFTGFPKSTSPVTPTKPGSPPARSVMARVTAQVSARLAARTPAQLWLKWSCEPERLMPPTDGL
mgnify:CR=1 FL=1